jgi:hypothetical protein
MKHPAYYRLLEISDFIRSTSFEREIVSERYEDGKLTRTKTGHSSSSFASPFAQLSLDWISGLSSPTALFVIQHLIHDLKLYNLLWYWPTPKKSSEKLILKELVDKAVIFRTETIGIYLVNPLKLWRGTKFSCVECTKALLREHRVPSIELIRDLKPAAQYQVETNEDRIRKMLGSSRPDEAYDLE